MVKWKRMTCIKSFKPVCSQQLEIKYKFFMLTQKEILNRWFLVKKICWNATTSIQSIILITLVMNTGSRVIIIIKCCSKLLRWKIHLRLFDSQWKLKLMVCMKLKSTVWLTEEIQTSLTHCRVKLRLLRSKKRETYFSNLSLSVFTTTKWTRFLSTFVLPFTSSRSNHSMMYWTKNLCQT